MMKATTLTEKNRNSMTKKQENKMRDTFIFLTALVVLSISSAFAASHREAPGTAIDPKCDTTDFYAFRSWEDPSKVIFIENSDGLQDAYGGPNYFPADPDCVALIHIDNNGDGVEDITFQKTVVPNRVTGVADIPVNGSLQNTPVLTIQQNSKDNEAIQFTQSYRIDVIFGPYWTVTPDSTFTTPATFNVDGINKIVSAKDHAAITGVRDRDNLFRKPHDNAGEKTFPESQGGYSAYANQFVYDVELDNNRTLVGRVFYGQRKDAFKIALGKVFDLLNIDPLAADGTVEDALAKNNVTSWAMEVNIDDIAPVISGRQVIGVWATRGRVIRELDDEGKPIVTGLQQKSRMGNPLVNELVIGTIDKDTFNQASHPTTDSQFADYVTRPSFPAILEAVFQVPAPTNFPRRDLINAFLRGFTLQDGNGGVLLSNRFGSIPAEMLRIDLSVAPTPPAAQSSLGVLSLVDFAGFPNGRRPGDDVVDIVTRVAMGVLCYTPAPNAGIFGCVRPDAPVGNAPLGDGVASTPEVYTAFPFLETPVPGSKL